MVLAKEMGHPKHKRPVSALLQHVEMDCMLPPTLQVLIYWEVQVFNVTYLPAVMLQSNK